MREATNEVINHEVKEKEEEKGWRRAKLRREGGREGMCSAVILGSWDRGALNIVFTLIYILKQNRDYRSIYGGGKYRRRARSCLWEGWEGRETEGGGGKQE